MKIFDKFRISAFKSFRFDLYVAFRIYTHCTFFHYFDFYSSYRCKVRHKLSVDICFVYNVFIYKYEVSYTCTYQCFTGIRSHSARTEYGNGFSFEFFKIFFTQCTYGSLKYRFHQISPFSLSLSL